jgi:curved DNA-binding protein CbpA
MLNPWDVLGITPTEDLREVKRAYARKLKLFHPEDDAEGFQALRTAYELVLQRNEILHRIRMESASSAPGPTEPHGSEPSAGPIERLMGRVREVWSDALRRSSNEAWEEILADDALWSVDDRNRFQLELFAFLTDREEDPDDAVWRLLDETFRFRSEAQSLYRAFRDPGRVDRILDRIHRACEARPVRLPGGRTLFAESFPGPRGSELETDEALEELEEKPDRADRGGRRFRPWWVGIGILTIARLFGLLSDTDLPRQRSEDGSSRAFLEANAGVDPGSARKLAEAYWSDEPRNEKMAFFWYRSAALRADKLSQRVVGDAYRAGWADGGEDLAQAVTWYRLAADRNDAVAALWLALLYQDGKGVERSDAEAFRWMSRASALRLPLAQARLGLFYELGTGVPPDEVEAVRLYRSAADEVPWARFQLGRMYAAGRGVERDDVEAFYWLSRAAEDSSLAAAAKSPLESLRERLTSDEMTEVERRLQGASR